MKIRMGFESRSYRVKQQFRRRMEATRVLNDDFYVRAQLMLNFLQKHGDRIVQKTPGPRRRFPNTLQLAQHALQKSSGIEFPLDGGVRVCVCVYTLILS